MSLLANQLVLPNIPFRGFFLPLWFFFSLSFYVYYICVHHVVYKRRPRTLLYWYDCVYYKKNFSGRGAFHILLRMFLPIAEQVLFILIFCHFYFAVPSILDVDWSTVCSCATTFVKVHIEEDLARFYILYPIVKNIRAMLQPKIIVVLNFDDVRCQVTCRILNFNIRINLTFQNLQHLRLLSQIIL